MKKTEFLSWGAIWVSYFAFWLVPVWLPWIKANPLSVLYALSLLVVVPGLILALPVGVIGLGMVRWRGLSPQPVYRKLAIGASVGLFAFVVASTLVRTLPRALPTGSDSMRFDAELWRSPESARFVRGDITPRQKMLGSLIERLETAPSRSEVESMLGDPHPRDSPLGIGDSHVHYPMGHQRDAFIGLDSEWLFIWFDDSQHFERYEIYVD